MKKSKIIVVFFCCFGQLSLAQEPLALQQAVEIALKNNYSISLAKNQSEIFKNDVTFGNAGMLPQLTVTAGRSFSRSNTKQEYLNGSSVDRAGVSSNNTVAGLALAWTLFDGLKMFATYDKLKELEALGETRAKIQIENAVEQVMVAYFNIVAQKQLLATSESTLDIYTERAKIAEERWNIGNGSKSDFLQAKVDLNEQKSLRIKQRNRLSEEKMKLNELLGRPAETGFDVMDKIEVNAGISLENALNAAKGKNNAMIFFDKNVKVGELELKELRTQRLPQIAFNSAYHFSRTQNQAGFFLLNQNRGLNAGLSASWTLFNGLELRRKMEDARISLMGFNLLLEDARLKMESELHKAFQNYQSALESLALEEENSRLAKENSEIMLERFRLGNANSIDIRTAQKSYDDALARLVEARLGAKVSEVALMRLKGELVK